MWLLGYCKGVAKLQAEQRHELTAISHILGPWVVQSDAALWHLQAPASGRYQAQLLHACDDANAGSAFVIETDLSQLEAKIGSTALAGSISLRKSRLELCN